jgi:hypothetical protein
MTITIMTVAIVIVAGVAWQGRGRWYRGRARQFRNVLVKTASTF